MIPTPSLLTPSPLASSPLAASGDSPVSKPPARVRTPTNGRTATLSQPQALLRRKAAETYVRNNQSSFEDRYLESAMNKITILMERASAPYEGTKPLEVKLHREHAKGLLQTAFDMALIDLNNLENPSYSIIILNKYSKILHRYALICFQEEKYHACKHILSAAMVLELYMMGMITDIKAFYDFYAFKSLHQYEDEGFFNHVMMDKIDQYLLNTKTADFLKSAEFKNVSDERAKTFASLLIGLGNTCQYLESKNSLSAANTIRFMQIYNLADGLLITALKTDDAILKNQIKALLAEIRYGAWPMLHLRNFPSDYNTALKLLQEALTYNDKIEMRAKVAYKSSCLMRDAGEHEKRLCYLREAIFLRNQLPKADPSANANIHAQLASAIMKSPAPNINEAQNALDTALKYAHKCRKAGIDKQIFIEYNLVDAELKIRQKLYTEAKKVIQVSLEALSKVKDCPADKIRNAEALKKLIEEREAS